MTTSTSPRISPATVFSGNVSGAHGQCSPLPDAQPRFVACSPIASLPATDAADVIDATDNKLGFSYSAYVMNLESRIEEVQAASRHIRQRRLTAIARGTLRFAAQVLVVTGGIILGTNFLHTSPKPEEARQAPDRLLVPIGTEMRDQSDPVVDEPPRSFVYVRANAGFERLPQHA